MKRRVFRVRIKEGDKDSPYYGDYRNVALEMCRDGLRCPECKKSVFMRDNCDHIWMLTNILTVAENKVEELRKEGNVAKIVSDVVDL